jgi:hypothetical protein
MRLSSVTAMDPAGLPAIRHMHGCEARWVESVPVHELHEGNAAA